MSDTLPAETHAGSLLQQIERLVRSDIDPARLEAMLGLYNRERDRAQLEAFNSAMTELQSEVYDVATTGRNPTFRSAYPTLHDLLKEARPYYTGRGFGIRYGSVLQKTTAPPVKEGWSRVVLIISHNSGHWEEHYYDGPPDTSRTGRTPVQNVGSTVTYLRRYLLMMILNLVPRGDPTDDDGAGTAPITPEQIDEIKKLVEELNLTAEQFSNILVAVNAKTLEQVQAQHYPRIINTLIRRKERQEQ